MTDTEIKIKIVEAERKGLDFIEITKEQEATLNPRIKTYGFKYKIL